MTSAFDLDPEVVNEVQSALSDIQTERHDAPPQTLRNCEIVPLGHFAHRRRAIASAFSTEHTGFVQESADPVPPESTPVDADQVGPSDAAPIVGLYLRSHPNISNNHLKGSNSHACDNHLKGLNQAILGREYLEGNREPILK